MSTNIYTPVSFRVLSTKRAYYTCKICIKNNARLPRIIYKQARYFISVSILFLAKPGQTTSLRFVPGRLRCPGIEPRHRHIYQAPKHIYPAISYAYDTVSVGWSPLYPHPRTQCYKSYKLLHISDDTGKTHSAALTWLDSSNGPLQRE